MRQHRDTRAYVVQLDEKLDGHSTRMMHLQVSFMNTAGVTVVVTVLANFQIQIVLDL